MKTIISVCIVKGWNDPNPMRQEQWRKITCAGEVPAPQEWMQYTFRKLKEDDFGNVLKLRLKKRNRLK